MSTATADPQLSLEKEHRARELYRAHYPVADLVLDLPVDRHAAPRV